MTQQRKVEDYMKTIYLLQSKGPVRGMYIAQELGVSRPTVAVSLKRLEQEGYLRRQSDHSVSLTPKGLTIAKEIAERNSSILQLLVCLGVGRETAARDACSMEHAISRESYCALLSLAESRSVGKE